MARPEALGQASAALQSDPEQLTPCALGRLQVLSRLSSLFRSLTAYTFTQPTRP